MELYHVLNRGVDGRQLFADTADYLRFVHDLYEFNDAAPAPQFSRRLDVGHRMSNIQPRKRLVDLYGWCLMKDHYHLLLSERVEGGRSLFLRKLNVGYARAFNEKHRRSGVLFQGRTKKVLISNERHFNYILHYIHLNPLDYLEDARNWRIRSKSGIASAKQAFEYLNTYRWNSYLDYAGRKNFPSLLTRSLFDADGDYTHSLREYLKDDSADLSDSLTLE